MAFGDFGYPEVLTEFGLTDTTADLLPHAKAVPLEAAFGTVFGQCAALAGSGNATEKARSELLIAPILVDVWSRFGGRITLHSGAELVADRAAKLVGVCDFLMGRGPQMPRVAAPLLVVIEANRDLIENGFGQCIASMVGIQRFNRSAGKPDGPVYGVVTTGTVWRLLRLDGATLTYDYSEFTLEPVDRLVGRLVAMIESLLAVASA